MYVSVFSVISNLKPNELINILRVGDETVPEEGVELVLRLKKSKKILTYLRGRGLSSEKFRIDFVRFNHSNIFRLTGEVEI